MFKSRRLLMLIDKCNCNCYKLDNSCQCQELCEGYSYLCEEIGRMDNVWVDWYDECCECDNICDCYCDNDNNCDCEYLYDYGCNCGDCGDDSCGDNSCGDCGDYYYDCGDNHCECYIYCHIGEEIFTCQCECDYTCEGCDVK